MTDEISTTEQPKERKLANIVRGQIPVALVYMIRFQEKGNKEGDVAKKYGTTGGKVADIVKGRNFGYVGEDFVPTQEQKDAAINWLKQVPDYDSVGTDEVVTAIEKLPTASEEQANAFLNKRSGSRARQPRPEGSAPKERPARKAKEHAPAAAATAADVDALLS